jgi:hypothetical protein
MNSAVLITGALGGIGHALCEEFPSHGFLSEKNEVLPLLDYSGLKIFLASPRYLVAMKCMSMRLGRDHTDLSDVRFLMDRLGLSESTQVLDLVARNYPAERIPPKTRFAIEEICQNLPSP